MGTFVIGDLHGASKALEQCLQRSGFDPEKDTLIQLGDVCDGHNDVYDCVEMLINIPNLVAIRGNHDTWLLEFIETDFHPVYWTYGGLGTLRSYLDYAGKSGKYRSSGSGYKTALEAADIPKSHKNFFASQQLYHVDAHNRCFVHAGFRNNLPFDQQRAEDFYWNRSLWEEAIAKSVTLSSDGLKETYLITPHFSEIYLGHTATLKWGTDQPLNAFNIWNLDTGDRKSVV